MEQGIHLLVLLVFWPWASWLRAHLNIIRHVNLIASNTLEHEALWFRIIIGIVLPGTGRWSHKTIWVSHPILFASFRILGCLYRLSEFRIFFFWIDLLVSADGLTLYLLDFSPIHFGQWRIVQRFWIILRWLQMQSWSPLLIRMLLSLSTEDNNSFRHAGTFDAASNLDFVWPFLITAAKRRALLIKWNAFNRFNNTVPGGVNPQIVNKDVFVSLAGRLSDWLRL